MDPYEAAINGLDASPDSADASSDSADEDAIYDVEPIHFKSAAKKSRLRLYEDEPEFRDGATKAKLEGNDSGQIVYEHQSSDCSVTIQRLVWLDGWRGPSQDEAMTLVVLKLGFKPEGLGAKVSYASLQLRLKSDTKGGKDPQLVAWGPFRRPEMWNYTDAHKRTSVTPSFQLAAGGAGQQVTLGIERTKEVNWDARYTDYGLSSEKGGSTTKSGSTGGKSPNAVLWQVFENKLLQRGITPEIRVAALFSRPEASRDYLAEVKIVAHKGIIGETAYRVLHRFGYSGGDTIYWKVAARPGKKDHSYTEGLAIVQEIDPASLGKLVDPLDSTNLEPQWLNKWDRFDPSVAESVAATKQQAHLPEPKKAAEKKPATETAASTPRNEVGEPLVTDTEPGTTKTEPRTTETEPFVPPETAARLPPPRDRPAVTADDVLDGNRGVGEFKNLDAGFVGDLAEGFDAGFDAGINAGRDTGPSVGIDTRIDAKIDVGINSAAPPLLDVQLSSRLVELEKRAAQAESRIAEQDQRILELQQTLTRVAQALLVPALNARRG